MAGFLALIWNPGDPAGLTGARSFCEDPDLTRAPAFRADAAGLWLIDLSAPCGRAAILPVGEAGAVIGSLFRRAPSLVPEARLNALPRSAEDRIRVSCGQALLDDYWGCYVAFIRNGARLTVIADPAASVPCFYTRRGPLVLVFSHLERCPASVRRTLTINRAFVSQLLAYDKIQNGQTGLNEVRELQAGYGLSLTRDGAEEFLAWDPRAVSRGGAGVSIADAADALKQTARYVVQSHALCVPKLSINLSGGFDSALVAAMLTGARERVDVQGVHFVLGGGDPAETSYARRLAACLELDLAELQVDPHQLLPSPDAYPPTARPYREFLGQEILAAQSALPGLRGRATFTGQGGDHLFLETRSPLMFVDYLLDRGPGGRMAEELLNAARLSGRSVWEVLREVLPCVVTGRERPSRLYAPLSARHTRVNRQAHADLDPAELLPAWARRPAGIPPAKFAQIVSLVHLFQIRSALAPASAGPLTHPLISQPLVELCLKIPAYTLCASGQPRGLARRAMEGLIPDEIRLRRSKGDASRYFIEQLSANHALLAETLLHGELVAGGYADPADIRAFLAPGSFRTQTFGRMNLVYYVIECWLRRWKSELSAV
jgi:asparagine synthase (glutamine-hydrolysing)